MLKQFFLLFISILFFVTFHLLSLNTNYKLRQNQEIQVKKNSSKYYFHKNINSKFSELQPVLSADGTTLFFAREGSDQNEGYDQKSDDQDVWMSKYVNHNWQIPIRLEAPFNTVTYDFPVSSSVDAKTLYLGKVYKEDGTILTGISKSRFIGNRWTQPEEVKIKNFYNNSKFTYYNVSVSESVLILSLSRKDSLGQSDLYISFLDPSKENSWSEPLSLGRIVNSKYNEVTPYLANDLRTLYFSSNRPRGVGKYDIYMTRRLGNTWKYWTRPINLGKTINTKNHDYGHIVTSDGRSVVYSTKSDTPEKNKRIFKLKLPVKFRPYDIVLLEGKVTGLLKKDKYKIPAKKSIFSSVFQNKGKKRKKRYPVVVKYSLFNDNLFEGRVEVDENGYFKIVVPQNNRVSIWVERKGYIGSNEIFYYKKSYLNKKKSSESKEKKFDDLIKKKINLVLTPLRAKEKIRLPNIYFASGSSILFRNSYRELVKFANLLKANRDLKIQIEGYSDSVGYDKMNLFLSKRRALFVKGFLLKHGVAKEQIIKVIGLGEANPVVDNKTVFNRQQNRRVEFLILKDGSEKKENKLKSKKNK